MAGINYTPPPSLARLFTEPKFYNVLIGPVGSAKTTACVMFLFWNMLRQEPGPDGVRRTRYAICRNTLVDMRLTVMQDLETLLGPLININRNDNIAFLDFPWEGTRVKSEIYFIPLELQKDQRRLLSSNISGLWVNEAREVPFDLIIAASARCGRWPRKADGGCTFRFVLMDSNPPAVGSKMWEFLEGPPPTDKDGNNILMYNKQPSGRSPQADWLEHLPEGYYENLVHNQSEEWVRVHVDGEYGRDPSGLAVFGSVFSPLRHIGHGLKLNPKRPFVIGMDPGLSPAAVLTQLDENGRLMVLREAYGQATGLVRFLDEKIAPWLAMPELQRGDVMAVVDPIAGAREGLHATTALSEIRRYVDARLAATNEIEVRIDAVEDALRGVGVDGQSKVLIDADHCPTLVRALQYEYVYRVSRDGRARPLPDKTHPWSDLVDALGYVIATGVPGGRRKRLAPPPVHVPFSAWM